MLHTISTTNQSTINPQLISAQDAVLFWQNGVFLALKNNSLLNDIMNKTEHCYIINSDIEARGLKKMIDSRLKVINIQQVVELTANNYPQINWE
ncbi:sulfurtransferase complex subunit TusB [Gilliamella sp. Pra-s65]|uniref:sulfurtransferase complex subunit TusB n=1 Tax=unclassified Gilliamella TaxID=2685620 RepID=UPI001322BD27|nr:MULTISPECIES: sulfurtransferase complex subunit TusB [unclassified Gilliamella]MWN32629.1 sulfurtransferase complex subunit TusB [Gilliamella sp. Pra-s60]MWN91187.1 sulfurtransferase complex subunit TusB [Gilliamella sp. Pra-s65]MWP30060.1 sulfurtransferase complex subunit TusB [Gilliamella sp. Pra-s54]MWP74163.1 sulfurtransferase complex subunit TusB [Gilliamella sp. Pra-s52]